VILSYSININTSIEKVVVPVERIELLLDSLIDQVVVVRNWFRILFDLRCKWLSFSTYTHLEATPPSPTKRHPWATLAGGPDNGPIDGWMWSRGNVVAFGC